MASQRISSTLAPLSCLMLLPDMDSVQTAFRFTLAVCSDVRWIFGNALEMLLGMQG